MINNDYKYLLEVLNIAIHNEKYGLNKYDIKELSIEKIYKLSKTHNILPLIYEGINLIDSIDKSINEIQLWKRQAMAQEINQIQRSERFLDIYKNFLDNNIKPIVVKGITCRNIYPFPDSRISSDEDILVKKEDFELCHKILTENNMKIIDGVDIENKDVVAYICTSSRLMIEVHKTLFNENEEEHVNIFNAFYKDCFNKSIHVNVQGRVVYTFPETMNLMYLINHTTKHFLHGGVGIRQVCDIVKFIECNSKEIDWDYLWKNLKKIKYDYFVFNLLNIGELYLGLDKMLIQYPDWYDYNNVDSRALLEDILDAGIFGSSSMERKQSSLITLDAVNNREIKTHKSTFKAALFPSVLNLKGRYTYLNKKPYLLPIAWTQRVISYVNEKGIPQNIGKAAYGSISIGKQRVELLKQYKII